MDSVLIATNIDWMVPSFISYESNGNFTRDFDDIDSCIDKYGLLMGYTSTLGKLEIKSFFDLATREIDPIDIIKTLAISSRCALEDLQSINIKNMHYVTTVLQPGTEIKLVIPDFINEWFLNLYSDKFEIQDKFITRLHDSITEMKLGPIRRGLLIFTPIAVFSLAIFLISNFLSVEYLWGIDKYVFLFLGISSLSMSLTAYVGWIEREIKKGKNIRDKKFFLSFFKTIWSDVSSELLGISKRLK